MGGVASGITGIVGSVAGGILGSNSSKTASGEQVAAQNASMTNAQDIYNANSANYTPYITEGTAALSQLGTGLGQNGSLGRQFTQADFQQSPAYQFNLQQGQNAINNAQSVRGGALSGGAQKAIQGYSQQNANNAYNTAYNQFTQNQQQNYQQLSGQAAQGLNATNALGNLGSQYANQVTGINTNIGNAQAAGTMGSANALSSMFGGALSAGSSLMGGSSGLSSLFGGGSAAAGSYAGGLGAGTVDAGIGAGVGLGSEAAGAGYATDIATAALLA